MKVEIFSETSVNFYQTIWRYVQKSKNPLKENLFKLYKWNLHTGTGRNCEMKNSKKTQHIDKQNVLNT